MKPCSTLVDNALSGNRRSMVWCQMLAPRHLLFAPSCPAPRVPAARALLSALRVPVLLASASWLVMCDRVSGSIYVWGRAKPSSRSFTDWCLFQSSRFLNALQYVNMLTPLFGCLSWTFCCGVNVAVHYVK